MPRLGRQREVRHLTTFGRLLEHGTPHFFRLVLPQFSGLWMASPHKSPYFIPNKKSLPRRFPALAARDAIPPPPLWGHARAIPRADSCFVFASEHARQSGWMFVSSSVP